jgi:protein tyrosine phosphatase (PTP) superfamily phosphohydrolase (DUF442 family)
VEIDDEYGKLVTMADPTGIAHWRRLNDRLTTSGQVSEHDLAALGALGVRHIVNLALHSHEKALPDEAASVAKLAMTYTHIPVEFSNPNEADFARFCAAMQSIGAGPAHVHCIMNWRVAAFVYRDRREVLGMDEAQARADMEAVWRPEGVWAAFVEPMA